MRGIVGSISTGSAISIISLSPRITFALPLDLCAITSSGPIGICSNLSAIVISILAVKFSKSIAFIEI